MTVALLQLLQLGDEIFANLMRILYQVLLLEDIENGESCCTCQMVATKGCTQLTIYRSKLWRNQHATHRETVTDTLGYGDELANIYKGKGTQKEKEAVFEILTSINPSQIKKVPYFLQAACKP